MRATLRRRDRGPRPSPRSRDRHSARVVAPTAPDGVPKLALDSGTSAHRYGDLTDAERVEHRELTRLGLPDRLVDWRERERDGVCGFLVSPGYAVTNGHHRRRGCRRDRCGGVSRQLGLRRDREASAAWRRGVRRRPVRTASSRGSRRPCRRSHFATRHVASTAITCVLDGLDVIRQPVRREEPRPADQLAGADRLDDQRAGRRVDLERDLPGPQHEERSAGSSSAARNSPISTTTLRRNQPSGRGPPAPGRPAPAARASRSRIDVDLHAGPRRSWPDLLGEIDPGRAPGDAASAADAARLAELVPPGRELVGEPLPVAGTGVATDAARAVERRVPEGEAGVPPLHPLGPRSPLNDVTSSIALQKQVGQTSVQFVHDRHREATSSQRGWSRLARSTSRARPGSRRRVIESTLAVTRLRSSSRSPSPAGLQSTCSCSSASTS